MRKNVLVLIEQNNLLHISNTKNKKRKTKKKNIQQTKATYFHHRTSMGIKLHHVLFSNFKSVSPFYKLYGSVSEKYIKNSRNCSIKAIGIEWLFLCSFLSVHSPKVKQHSGVHFKTEYGSECGFGAGPGGAVSILCKVDSLIV